MCCRFLYWSWVFTHSWKAFLCTLLTEGFTCVCFWYLYSEASYFQSSGLVSLFFCLVWEMDLILSFSKQWSTRLASCYLTDHDCRGELRRVIHHTPDSAATVYSLKLESQNNLPLISMKGDLSPFLSYIYNKQWGQIKYLIQKHLHLIFRGTHPYCPSQAPQLNSGRLFARTHNQNWKTL